MYFPQRVPAIPLLPMVIPKALSCSPFRKESHFFYLSVYAHVCMCMHVHVWGVHVCATVHRRGQRTVTGGGSHLPHCVRQNACLLLTRQPSHFQGFSCGCLPSCLGILKLRYGALLYVCAGDLNSSLHAYIPPQLEQHLFFLRLTPPCT